MKIALLTSTGASVARCMQQSIEQSPGLSGQQGFDVVITDRLCGAQAFADDFGLPCFRIDQPDPEVFSEQLAKLLKSESIDYLILFFTRLLRGPLLDSFAGRIINFHPSLLPACPGQRGFEDTMASGALFFGSTVHWVDAGMDTGQPIMQAIGRKQPGGSEQAYRHQVFAQQVASLFQLIQWLRAGRLSATFRTGQIQQADYQRDSITNPALEPAAEQLYHLVIAGS